MSSARVFTSWLAPYFERFVALKRASGASYVSGRKLLLAFDLHVHTQAPQPPLQQETLMQYLASLERLTLRGRDNVVAVVWPALAYASGHGARVEELPARPPTSSQDWRQRQPRILTCKEAQSLLAAARQLRPQSWLRPTTITTLLGLLYTTGLRIAEALGLDIDDLDTKHRILTVRKGKFGKSRCVPLLESTVDALVRYVNHPLRPLGTEPSAPFFVSDYKRRLAVTTARSGILSACRLAGIPEPWPRPHDFRHTFAISRVAAWYEQGRDVNGLLPALSTYLGHVSVENTRRYLIVNGVLLQHAAARFARQTSCLDGVLP